MKRFFIAVFLLFPMACLALDATDQMAINDGNRFVEKRPVRQYQGNAADYIAAWEDAMGVADLLSLKYFNILNSSSVKIPTINKYITALRALPEQNVPFGEFKGDQREAEMLRQMVQLFGTFADEYMSGKVSYHDYKQVKFFVESEGRYLAEKLRHKEYECSNPNSTARRIWEMSNC